jgi:hypothetical protein
MVVAFSKKMFTQIGQILMGSYGGKMRTYEKPRFFIKSNENGL